MGTCENLWKHVGNLWEPAGICENLWELMENLWESGGNYVGNLLELM